MNQNWLLANVRANVRANKSLWENCLFWQNKLAEVVVKVGRCQLNYFWNFQSLVECVCVSNMLPLYIKSFCTQWWVRSVLLNTSTIEIQSEHNGSGEIFFCFLLFFELLIQSQSIHTLNIQLLSKRKWNPNSK